MMRWVLVACFLAAPARASEAALDRAVNAIRRHGLLTAKELRCSSLVASDRIGDVVIVDVREKHNKACGGAPETTPRRFSLEINMRTGVIRWDNNFPDMEMVPIPRRAR